MTFSEDDNTLGLQIPVAYGTGHSSGGGGGATKRKGGQVKFYPYKERGRKMF